MKLNLNIYLNAVLSMFLLNLCFGHTISVKIYDTEKAIIEEVKITITSENGGDQEATIGENGEYSFSDVSSGKYTLTAKKTDYETHTEDINISSDHKINITLNEESEGYLWYIILIGILALSLFFIFSGLNKASEKNTDLFFHSINKSVTNYLVNNKHLIKDELDNFDLSVTPKELFKKIKIISSVEIILIKKDANAVVLDILMDIKIDGKQIKVKISKDYSWDKISEFYRSEFIKSGKKEIGFKLYSI